MQRLLMPQATAVWLIDNTVLNFDQIAHFCNIHPLEIQAIADGEVAAGIEGQNPMLNGQLNRESIEKCEKDSTAQLVLVKSDLPQPLLRSKGPRYTPLSKRADKPDAIAWCLKSHPELSEAQLIRLIGTTRQTINSIRNRNHWNHANLQPRNPADLGLCRYQELEQAVEKARNRAKKNPLKAS